MVIEDQALDAEPESSVEDLFFKRYKYGFCASNREDLTAQLGITSEELKHALCDGSLRELVGREKNLYHLRRPERIAAITDPAFQERVQKNVEMLESVERKDYFILERIFLGEEINYTLSTTLDSLKQKGFIQQDRTEYFLVGPLRWMLSISYGEEYAEPVGPSRSFPEREMIPVSFDDQHGDRSEVKSRIRPPVQTVRRPVTDHPAVSKEDRLLEFFIQKLSHSSFYIQNPGQIAEHVPHEHGELGHLGKRLSERGCITYQFGIVMPTDRLRARHKLPALELPPGWDAGPQAYVVLCFLSHIHSKDEKRQFTHYSLINKLSHLMGISGPSAKQAVEFLKDRGYVALTRDGLYFPPSVQTLFKQAPLKLPSPQPYEPARKAEHENATRAVAPPRRPAPYSFNANQARVLNAIQQLDYKVTNKKLSEATGLDPDYVSGIMKGFCRRDVIYTSPQGDHLSVQFHPGVEAALPTIKKTVIVQPAPAQLVASIPVLDDEPAVRSWSCKGKRLSDYVSYMQTVVRPAMVDDGLDANSAPTAKWLKDHGFSTFYNGIAVTKRLKDEGVCTYSQFMERAGYQPNKSGRPAKA